jgi:hypothetical protein
MAAPVASSTFGLVRYQSLAFTVTLGSADDFLSNAALLAGGTPAFSALTAKGPLAVFLAATYADTAAAELAFRLIGGQIEVRQISGTATTVIAVKWNTTGLSLPFLSFVGGADQVLEVRLVTPHSIVQ